VGAAVGAPVRAQVTFYDIFKVQDFSQTSNAQPTTPVSYQGTVADDDDLDGDR
jgi:hypothetical protein